MTRLSMHAKATAIAIAALLAGFALAGCAARANETAAEPSSATAPSTSSPATIAPSATGSEVSMGAITVSARSEVKVVPDKATIGVGVDTEAADAETAQSENAKLVNAVIARLKELGVDEKSIQTSWTNLSPVWDYESSEEHIRGYSMNTRLQVSDLDIDAVGQIMQECVTAGATSVDGPNFFASSYEEAYQEALTAAVAASRPKAEAIANASGVTLGGVVGVTEGYQDYSIAYGASATMDAAATEAAMDVEPGELSVEATVTVSYAIA